MTNNVWWEKTVEYHYVIKYLSNMFAIPLDGKAEKMGDTVFARDGKYILIEFKRSSYELNSEVDKYENYELARDELYKEHTFHFAVYGYMENEIFYLEAINYFSINFAPQRFYVEHIKECGVNFNEFASYTKDLIGFKKSKYAGSGGGLVVGISDSGIITMDLSEFAADNELIFKNEGTNNDGPSSP